MQTFHTFGVMEVRQGQNASMGLKNPTDEPLVRYVVTKTPQGTTCVEHTLEPRSQLELAWTADTDQVVAVTDCPV